jgi:hypothetical protein
MHWLPNRATRFTYFLDTYFPISKNRVERMFKLQTGITKKRFFGGIKRKIWPIKIYKQNTILDIYRCSIDYNISYIYIG